MGARIFSRQAESTEFPPFVPRICTGLPTDDRVCRTYDGAMSALFASAQIPSPMSRGDDEVARLRIPPHSLEAEQSVIGGLLLDNSAWDRAADLLTESDFYRFEHRAIYSAIGSLVNATKPADVITVYEQLQSLGAQVTRE